MKLASLALLLVASTAFAAERPNVIVILADDMGFSDLGCYGGEIPTPNLDTLAAGGLRFTQFYNTARCCPTRASLLTGLYPHQAGVGHMTSDSGQPGYAGDLNRHCVTIAEALRPAGYRNYMVGKWHVTRHAQPEAPRHNWPLHRGFDRYYGTIVGAGSFWDPAGLVRDDRMISAQADPDYKPVEYYYTQALSDHACRFVRDHQHEHASAPFFMYLAYTAAHWPMHAPESLIEQQRGRYGAGYDAIRQARLAKARRQGVIDPAWTLTPTQGNWDTVTNRAWEERCMEVYAAMISAMDAGIGQLVSELQEAGQLDNTLILFLQDNGGCAEAVGRQPDVARGAAPSLAVIPATEILTAVHPRQTRDGWPMLTGRQVMPGPRDTYIAYGEAWANVSNTPFREYKHWVHEGGISTPLIAHWPRRITARGELRHQPGHLIDIMATCVELAGATYPREISGQPVTPLEGRSLVGAFDNRPLERPLFWEHEGNRAVREGDWKLVAKGPAAPWELYNLKQDRTETVDLASREPQRVKALAAQWEQWARRAQVLPWIWKPAYGEPEEPAGSSQRKFELRAGQELSREQSPRIVQKPLEITVKVSQPAASGVLVAQGGSAHGYALFLDQGKLVFAARLKGKLFQVTSRETLPAGPWRIRATLAKSGDVALIVNDRPCGSGKFPGLLAGQPVDGLQVGQDLAGAVGGYQGPHAFGGTIESVVVEIAD